MTRRCRSRSSSVRSMTRSEINAIRRSGWRRSPPKGCAARLHSGPWSRKTNGPSSWRWRESRSQPGDLCVTESGGFFLAAVSVSSRLEVADHIALELLGSSLGHLLGNVVRDVEIFHAHAHG